jgi:hypothetical protein
MRDKIKDKQYFLDYILEEQNSKNYFNTKLNNKEVRQDRILPVKREIDAINSRLFVAHYSIGEKIENIRNDFLEILYDMPKYWSPTGGYIDMIWMLSIAIMYEVSNEEFQVLTKLVKDNKIEDWLINYLAAYRDKEIDLTGLQVRMKNPYEYIKNIVNNPNNETEKLKEYLENKWYKGHQEMAWYNIHLHKEKLYSGYWSFESGAIAKILGIDDTNLKDVPYYPYDLVHYKD